MFSHSEGLLSPTYLVDWRQRGESVAGSVRSGGGNDRRRTKEWKEWMVKKQDGGEEAGRMGRRPVQWMSSRADERALPPSKEQGWHRHGCWMMDGGWGHCRGDDTASTEYCTRPVRAAHEIEWLIGNHLSPHLRRCPAWSRSPRAR